MSLSPDFPRMDETFDKPEALLRVPVGFASPLWALFAGAAVSGSAWWWMTRWARPENLEAMFGAAVAAQTEAARAIEAPVVEVAAPAGEAVAEVAAQSTAAVEPAVDAPVLAEPVGGEAAPIAPAVAEAAQLADDAGPKARGRKAEPKAE